MNPGRSRGPAGTRPVVVLGDITVDVVARHRPPLAAGSDTAAQVRLTGGGAGANVAAWLAHLGAPVALVGRVGADPAGRDQLAALRAAGVDVSRVVEDGDAPTGCVVVLVGPDGERTMLPDRGASLRLSVSDLPPVDAATHLHLSGYALLDDGPRGTALEALRRARAAGATVSVDPASAAPLARIGAPAFLAWTAGADLLLPNLDEARVLSGLDDAPAAARSLAKHYGAVVVTLGAEGALWAAGDEVVRVPAEPADVVDSTGAGDAFCAGLLRAWLRGARGASAVRAGVRVAARAVARLGARPPAM